MQVPDSQGLRALPQNEISQTEYIFVTLHSCKVQRWPTAPTKKSNSQYKQKPNPISPNLYRFYNKLITLQFALRYVLIKI